MESRLKMALDNAFKHATAERVELRKALSTTDFAPWTDMAPMVEDIREDISWMDVPLGR